MDKKQIRVQRDARVVSVSKENKDKYKVKAEITPYSYDVYVGFETLPEIHGKEIKKGNYIQAGQVIRG